MNKLKFVVFALLGLFAATSCSDKEEIEAKQRALVEENRALLSNTCKQDSDCIITGCRNTLCRTIVEEDYCDHRLVVALDHKEDLGVVEKVVKQRLTVREAETLRMGGYAAGQWTISFQASQAQRERVEQVLENLSLSGLSVLHENSVSDSQKLFDAFDHDPDVALRSMRGAGNLVEKQIRSGDLLSKDDIRDTWQAVKPKLDLVYAPDDIEHLWAYDVVTGKVSYLRFWPLDRRMNMSVKMWESLNIRREGEDLHVEGSLGDDDALLFEGWTDASKLIVLTLGNEVLASALPSKSIDDGKFDLIIKSAANHEDLMDALEVLKAISKMKGSVRLDQAATKLVEHDIECHRQHPRECGCVKERCAWKTNPDYNACLYEN